MKKYEYEAIKRMAEKNTKYYLDGKSLRDISDESGVSYDTILGRWKRGIRSYDELVSDEGLKNDSIRLEMACSRGRRFLSSAMKKGISMRDLSNRTGISASTIWNFICNDTDISSKRLTQMCDVVGVSMDYVVGLKRGNDGKEAICD